MWCFLLKRTHSTPACSRTRLFALFGALLLSSALLASCGSAATAQSAHLKPTPKPTLAPTPKPTPIPAPPPPPVQPPPPQGPVILDLRPASMSFVGHLDCPISNGAYVCEALVISNASNPGPLNWTAFVNFASNVTFSPGGGTLAPGTSVAVFIHIPTTDCNSGLFFFQGPANTHTITWAC